MSKIELDEIDEPFGGDVEALERPEGGDAAVSEVPFRAGLRIQDAPWAWRASNRLRAITRFARPNRLNTCAAFLAKPL